MCVTYQEQIQKEKKNAKKQQRIERKSKGDTSPIVNRNMKMKKFLIRMCVCRDYHKMLGISTFGRDTQHHNLT